MDYFDFIRLPVELNNIINNNVSGMYEYQWEQEHKANFKPCLDLIKSLRRTYSCDNYGNGFVMFDNYMTLAQQEVAFNDNGLVYSFPIEDFKGFDYYLHLNQDFYFLNESDNDLTDEDENIDMEDNQYDSEDDYEMV